MTGARGGLYFKTGMYLVPSKPEDKMARRCGSGAALIFTAMVLAGCALIDSVIEIEPVRSAARVLPRKATAAVSSADACGPGQLKGPGCASAQTLAKAASARYDSGPVLKPVKKEQDKKSIESEDSILVKAVKNWFRTGLQLHSWIARQ